MLARPTRWPWPKQEASSRPWCCKGKRSSSSSTPAGRLRSPSCRQTSPASSNTRRRARGGQPTIRCSSRAAPRRNLPRRRRLPDGRWGTATLVELRLDFICSSLNQGAQAHRSKERRMSAATGGIPTTKRPPEVSGRPMSAEERKVIFASSLGTVFEWYDFYIFGTLAAIVGKQFFAPLTPTAQFIMTLLAFAAGFAVRPFGALVFGRLGDMVGRKFTFLITITIMGTSTFLIGLLPGYASWGLAAPVILISLRLLQGLALGGEYGGAATYVAEHAPMGKRGYYTSFIQTTATLGLFLSLLVILFTRTYTGEAAFVGLPGEYWGGWRVPFLVSVVLLGISVWIRLRLNESPVFQKMKDEGK